MAHRLRPAATSFLLPPPTGVIRLRRSGQYVHVEPPVAGLERLFYTVDHVGLHLRGRHPAVLPLITPLLWAMTPAGAPCLQGFAGLEPLLLEFFGRANVEVERTGS